MPGNYESANKKLIDFLIGFLGVGVIDIVLGYLLFLIFTSISSPDWLVFLPYLLLLGLNVTVVVMGFRMKREYVAIGTLALFLLPMLVFGACIGFFAISGFM